VEKSQIVPPGLDGVSSGEDRAKIAAFFGDRKFHGFVATALESHVGRKNEAETLLSEVSNVCVSNRTFQFFLGMILPIQSRGILKTAMNQEHNSATMVKAAIDAVLQRGTNDASEAVQELADFLVMQGPQLLSKFGNAKGALIQHVAKYYPVMRNTTAGDHAPSFKSTAVLPDAKGNRELPQDLFPGEIESASLPPVLDSRRKLQNRMRLSVLYECQACPTFLELKNELKLKTVLAVVRMSNSY
jgi:hypothetical protein